jgi:hypothetical protein
MNTTLSVIQKLYAESGGCFEAELAHFLRHGYVFSQPDMFLMCAPCSLAQSGAITEPECADAWFVGLAVGDGALNWLIRQMPWYLPKVAWYRDFKHRTGRLHVWPTETLIAKLRR